MYVIKQTKIINREQKITYLAGFAEMPFFGEAPVVSDKIEDAKKYYSLAEANFDKRRFSHSAEIEKI